MNTYNTGHKDNVLILYRVKVDDITAVENCIKGRFSKKRYRSNKEHYKISLNEAIEGINKCIDMTESKKISEDLYYEDYTNLSMSRIKLDRNIKNMLIMLDNNDNIQYGGCIEYTKYLENIYIAYENIFSNFALNIV